MLAHGRRNLARADAFLSESCAEAVTASPWRADSARKHCCGDACLTQHGPRCRPVRGGRTMQQVASRDGLLLFNALKRSLQLTTSHTVHMQTSATYQGTARGRGVQQQQAQREHVTQRRRTASGSAAAAGSAGSKPLPAYWSAMKRKRKRWQDACISSCSWPSAGSVASKSHSGADDAQKLSLSGIIVFYAESY